MKKIRLPRAWSALATVAVVLGLSLTAFSRQAEPQGGPADSLKKGNELYKAGKYQEAIEAYKHALERDPNNDAAISYIAYSYNRMGNSAEARQWMKRRVEIPGLSPSAKAQTFTDLALLYWSSAHWNIISHTQGEETVKMLTEGIESAQKAVAIAPKSWKAFNLLNLLYRSSAATDTDPARQKELMAKADEALRQSVQFYEALSPQVQQQATDFFSIPTLTVVQGVDAGQAVHLGQATKKPVPDAFKDAKTAAVAVEVFVGRDGKVRQQRVIGAQGKPNEALVAAVKQWEFEPTTFEGHPVQVVEIITFPVK